MKLLSKIIYDGNNDIVVWKHPHNSFQSGAELIVPFTHEAILIKDGQAMGTYKPGKHIITEKPVFTSSIFNKKEQQILEVYYINKTLNLPIKWGTSSQLDLFDPLLNIPVRIGAHGEFEIKISNPRKFLMKVVGNISYMTKDMIQEFFRDKMGMFIKNAIASSMITDRISFYHISARLVEISDRIKGDLLIEFDNYGTSLESFLIANVVIPEEVKLTLEKAFVEKAKDRISNDTLINNVEEKKEKIIKEVKHREKNKCPECGGDVNRESLKCNECGVQLYIKNVNNTPKEDNKVLENEIYSET